ncbi:hypothetical protein THAOC_14753 [Thalassiosira oceanica]|uniref:Uncharacterized protein n=1 Tax=Thalassiosira oceanica TaxID=159749 RepID=K0SHQ1_THAOC|nr:hypothetical protein THAOC_14753 [Thalassiosira oceanica]|eukprot:EJK64509.1 hypothetical protein THAOC_14753 [Thalassiosira oceanica]
MYRLIVAWIESGRLRLADGLVSWEVPESPGKGKTAAAQVCLTDDPPASHHSEAASEFGEAVDGHFGTSTKNRHKTTGINTKLQESAEAARHEGDFEAPPPAAEGDDVLSDVAGLEEELEAVGGDTTTKRSPAPKFGGAERISAMRQTRTSVPGGASHAVEPRGLYSPARRLVAGRNLSLTRGLTSTSTRTRYHGRPDPGRVPWRTCRSAGGPSRGTEGRAGYRPRGTALGGSSSSWGVAPSSALVGLRGSRSPWSTPGHGRFFGFLSGLVVNGAESSRSGRSAVRVHDGAVCAISSGFVDDEAPAKDADEESGAQAHFRELLPHSSVQLLQTGTSEALGHELHNVLAIPVHQLVAHPGSPPHRHGMALLSRGDGAPTPISFWHWTEVFQTTTRNTK